MLAMQLKPVTATIFVCTTCRRGTEELEPLEGRSGFKLHEELSALHADKASRGDAGEIEVRPVACLSNCNRGCNVAFVSPGKWTYVVGNLAPGQNAGDILTFARQYAGHPEGIPEWRARPESIRKGVAARVPPLSATPAHEEALP
jgi:predicted metal-binding protein